MTQLAKLLHSNVTAQF